MKKSSFTVSNIISRIADIEEAVSCLRHVEQLVLEKFNLSEVVHNSRFNTFLSDPRRYFAEKISTGDLAPHRTIEHTLESNKHSQRVLSTSISAQMRNIYEAWTFLGILYHLADTIVEPKNLTSSLYLGNLTVRKSATVVAAREDGQEFAFFLDTALPYYNSDSNQIYRSRPDIGIYVVDTSNNICQHLYLPSNESLQLLALIECKESKVWPWTKKKIYDPYQTIKEKIEVTHLEMLLLYEQLYQSPALFLVSKERTPKKAVDIIQKTKIVLLDEVGFDREYLEMISNQIIKKTVE